MKVTFEQLKDAFNRVLLVPKCLRAPPSPACIRTA